MNGSDGLIRWMAGLALFALAAITGIVSYLHGLTVVHRTGTRGDVAYLIPLVADLMILTASLALLDAIRNHARKPKLAIVSLAAGIGWTVAMNVAAGWLEGTGAALIAAGVPVAFVLSLETLMGIVRLARSGGNADHPAATGDQCPHIAAGTVDEAVVAAYLHGRDCLGESLSQRQLSAAFGVPRAKVAALVGNLNGQQPPEVPAA
jgi:Protein of unknown function (DUF2637)